MAEEMLSQEHVRVKQEPPNLPHETATSWPSQGYKEERATSNSVISVCDVKSENDSEDNNQTGRLDGLKVRVKQESRYLDSEMKNPVSAEENHDSTESQSHSETSDSEDNTDVDEEAQRMANFAAAAQLQQMSLMMQAAAERLLRGGEPSTSSLTWTQQQQLLLAARYPAMTTDLPGSDDDDSQNDIDCMKKFYEKFHNDNSSDDAPNKSSKEAEVHDDNHDDDDDDKYVCEELADSKRCGLTFESNDMLMYHKTSAHGTPCKLCGIKIYPVEFMSEHIKDTHHFQASENDDSDTEKSLDDSDYKPGGGKNFPCTICGTSFSSRSTMTSHKSSVHGSPCQICGKRFLSDRYLRAHMRESHSDQVKLFPKTTILKIPVRSPEANSDSQEDPESSKSSIAVSESPSFCEAAISKKTKEKDIEGKIETIFALQKEALKMNSSLANSFSESSLRLPQDEEGNPQCLLCFKKFSSFKALKIHMKDIHIGVRNFSCDKCDQTFKRKGDLKSHMNKHLQPRSFKCYLCNETFNWQGNLTTHFRRKHSQEKEYACPICNKGFACSSGLKEHLNTHTDTRPHSCDRCDKTFKSKSAQRRHMLKLHSVGTEESLVKLKNKTRLKSHGCQHCTKKFRSVSELNLHIGIKEPHICKVCQTQCLCKDDYKSHMQANHRQTPIKKAEFRCDICQRDFLKRYNWQQHMAKLHSMSRQYNCPRCKAVFGTEFDLNQHKEAEHQGQVFPCVECGSEFKATSKLELHMRIVHNISVQVKEQEQILILKSNEDQGSAAMPDDILPNSSSNSSNDNTVSSFTNGNGNVKSLQSLINKVMKPQKSKERVISLQSKLECPVCQKSFRYNGYHFRRHLKRHREEKQKQNSVAVPRKKSYLTCEYCGKVLTTKFHYTTHMEEIHPDKSRVCTICGKEFKKMFHLKFHLAKHDNIKHPPSEFKCNLCGKIFKHLSRLKRHMNRHDTEKKYTCQYCGKSFKFPEGVNQHIRNSHEYTGGPFKCDMCGRLLKNQDNLKKHMELHYQGKPYACQGCDKRFARARNCRMHALKCHPDLSDGLSESTNSSLANESNASSLVNTP